MALVFVDLYYGDRNSYPRRSVELMGADAKNPARVRAAIADLLETSSADVELYADEFFQSRTAYPDGPAVKVGWQGMDARPRAKAPFGSLDAI